MELPIAHHFEEVVKLHPQRVALFCNGKYYTYIELFEIVSEIREAIEKN